MNRAIHIITALLLGGCGSAPVVVELADESRPNFADQAEEAAQRALVREAGRYGGMPADRPGPIAAPAPSAASGASFVRDASQRLSAALDAGNADEADKALSVLKSSGASGVFISSAERRIADLRRGEQSLRLYRQAKWLQGSAKPDGIDLVVFWEPWCGVCIRHMPHVQGIADRFGRQGLEVVGLTTLSRGSREAQARDILERTNTRYANAVVPSEVHDIAGVTGVPRMMVLDDGRVLWQGHPNALDESRLAAWLR